MKTDKRTGKLKAALSFMERPNNRQCSTEECQEIALQRHSFIPDRKMVADSPSFINSDGIHPEKLSRSRIEGIQKLKRYLLAFFRGALAVVRPKRF